MEENHLGWKLVNGVRQDVTGLFKLFDSKKSLRYEDFCGAWKEMKFHTIFSGRLLYIEQLEFTEEIFHIVQEYLSSVYELQTRVAALYTLYGLYFKQPMSNPVKIRFTKSEWEDFQSLISVCKNEKHFDTVFIYLKLLSNNAFIFAATTRATGLENGFRKYFKKRCSSGPSTFDVDLFYKPLLSERLVSNLEKLETLYCKKKLDLLGKKNLEFIDTHFATSMKSELKKYFEDCQKQLRKDCQKNEDDPETPTAGTSSSAESNRVNVNKPTKKRELSSTFLLAKKRAKLYLKKLQEEQKDSDKEKQCSLPDLDLL